MFKRLLLAFLFVLLGTGPACAAQDAGPPFERMLSEAKTAIMADPKTGLAKARAIVALAEKQQLSPRQQEILADGLWLEAEALTRINEIAAARAALDRAVVIASADGSTTELDGNIALSRARLAHADGDVALSLKSYLRAYEIFARIGEARGQSNALQGLGVIYAQARDFPRAISYYNRAAAIFSEDPAIQLAIENNVGSTLQRAARFQDALVHFNKALAIARSVRSPFLEARILTNIANVEAKLRDLRAAQKAADTALRLLRKSDDNGWAPFIWGVKAEIEFKRGDIGTAIGDLDKAFHGVDISKTIAPFRDIHEYAYKIYTAAGNYPLALAHLEALKRLDDEARSLAATANLALMNARFDFANQRLEIEHLKTEQLEREAKLRESRAAMQRQAFLFLISAALLFMIWMVRRHRLLRQHRDEISKANVELQHMVHERNVEIARRVETEAHLRLAMAAAEQANRAKTRFLANMSHELRTPLNAIIGFSEIIATGALPASKAQEYSSDINASGRKLLSILADILETARLDAGSVALSEGEVLLSECVEQALARAGQQADLSAKRIAVTGDGATRVRGDAQRLTQAIEKLVVNAASFTAPAGRIDIDYRHAPAGGIDITVSDDGAGIASDQLEHIMELFGQVESPYARSHGGIGLGLPIAKCLIGLHGGTLTIHSAVDKGTVVRIHLPAERDLASVPEQSTTAA